ncbi:hypothetical protein D3C80_1868490 [compost metagenome]
MVAITASMPDSINAAATSAVSSSLMSGAILIANGTRLPCVTANCSRRSAKASSNCFSESPNCRLRSPGVFGELTLTVM